MDSILLNSIPQVPASALNFVFIALFDLLFLSLRIGAFLIAAPFFGSRMVPLNVRIILIFSLAIFLQGWIAAPDFTNVATSVLVLTILVEIALGLTAGFVFAIAFATVSVAGEKIAATSGLSFAMQVDPATGTQSPIVSQFLTLFILMIFFATNAHLVVFSILLESYAFVPIGADIDFERLYKVGFLTSEKLFTNAALIMLPIVGVLFLINLAVGIITRSAPQLNLFSFGFPITILSVMFLLFLAVSPLAQMFLEVIENHILILSDLFQEVTRGGK